MNETNTDFDLPLKFSTKSKKSFSAVNLQTSFMIPPFGFSLFCLRGVAARTIHTQQIYKEVIPFLGLQLLALLILAMYPKLATWLSKVLLD